MRKKYTAILCISLAVLIVCGAFIIKNAADSRRAARQYEELSAEYAASSEPAPAVPAAETGQAEAPEKAKRRDPGRGPSLKQLKRILMCRLWTSSPSGR